MRLVRAIKAISALRALTLSQFTYIFLPFYFSAFFFLFLFLFFLFLFLSSAVVHSACGADVALVRPSQTGGWILHLEVNGAKSRY